MEQDFRTTFLVLEDDANDALFIRRAFTNGACSAFVCRNTSEARAYLMGAGMYADRARFPFPDLFLTDLRLGDESGVNFLGWVRSQVELHGLPVIILSGSLSATEVGAAKNFGVSRIIEKPADPSVLQAVVEKLSAEFCSPDPKSAPAPIGAIHN